MLSLLLSSLAIVLMGASNPVFDYAIHLGFSIAGFLACRQIISRPI